jgi:ribosomal protein L30/L7E
MKKTKYVLCGFFSPHDTNPSFVTPIFYDNNQIYIQKIDKENKVSILHPIDSKNFPYKLKRINSSLRISQNYPAIYGFAFGNGETVFKTKQDISTILKSRLEELESHPFVYLNVLNFIGVVEGTRNAIYRIKNIIAYRNEDMAGRLTNIELISHQLDNVAEVAIDWANILKFADQQGYINYWDLFSVLRNLIKLYGRIYIKCKLVRSIIGKKPKTKKIIKSLGFKSTKIGRQSSEIPLNRGNLKRLKTIITHILITKVRVYAEKEIVIKACDPLAIQKRYYKKDHSKVTKGKHHKDYLFQIVQP